MGHLSVRAIAQVDFLPTLDLLCLRKQASPRILLFMSSLLLIEDSLLVGTRPGPLCPATSPRQDLRLQVGLWIDVQFQRSSPFHVARDPMKHLTR